MRTYDYKGFIISRNTCGPTYALRWRAWKDGEGFLYADTLQCMRELITETLEHR